MEKCGFKRKQDAVDAATIAYAEYLSGGRFIKPSKMSYSDVLDTWMEEYGMLELAEQTIQTRIMQHYSSIIHQELGNKAFDFHTLRHTHATELEEAGVAIKEIQRRLGHKSEMTTRRVYVHHTDEMREQSIEIINTMFK